MHYPDKMMKLFEEKSKEAPLSDLQKRAKMGLMEDLKSQAEGQMREHLPGFKKVTVASPDKQGLEQGLEKAKELLGSSEGSPEEEAQESPEEEMSEYADMSPEELDQHIQMLMALKEKLHGPQ